MNKLGLWLGIALAFGGCENDMIDTNICTMEFRSIGLKVVGDSLTEFYTIRLSTSDTIRRSTNLESQTQFYLVLDDTYQTRLANIEEQFRFIGKIDEEIVVNENYVIRADKCHVYKVSGKDEVQL